MKNWLWEHFLPMCAKETVLYEYRMVYEENKKLRQENARLKSYIRGMQWGIRAKKKVEN